MIAWKYIIFMGFISSPIFAMEEGKPKTALISVKDIPAPNRNHNTSYGFITFNEAMDKVYLVKQENNTDFFGFPKGGAEYQKAEARYESPLEAAMREQDEEAGLRLIERNNIEAVSNTYPHGPRYKTTYYYLGKFSGIGKINGNGKDIKEGKWFDINDAINNLQSGEKNVLVNLIRKYNLIKAKINI